MFPNTYLLGFPSIDDRSLKPMGTGPKHSTFEQDERVSQSIQTCPSLINNTQSPWASRNPFLLYDLMIRTPLHPVAQARGLGQVETSLWPCSWAWVAPGLIYVKTLSEPCAHKKVKRSTKRYQKGYSS